MEAKDVDSVSRRVKIALAKFGNVDSDGDVITSGAFKKSIMERGPDSQTNRKIQFLRYHDFEHQIGIFEKLEETPDYLLGYAKLGRSTKGDDALLDYEDGIIREHSIGFNLITDQTVVRQDGIRELRELYLWEGSAVTFGANSETPVFTVGKSETTIDYAGRLKQKMDGCINALKRGAGTDERLFSIEMNLRVLSAKYNELIDSLMSKVPDQKGSHVDNKPDHSEKSGSSTIDIYNFL